MLPFVLTIIAFALASVAGADNATCTFSCTDEKPDTTLEHHAFRHRAYHAAKSFLPHARGFIVRKNKGTRPVKSTHLARVPLSTHLVGKTAAHHTTTAHETSTVHKTSTIAHTSSVHTSSHIPSTTRTGLPSKGTLKPGFGSSNPVTPPVTPPALCLDGSAYPGPNNQCLMAFPENLTYASGGNYTQYLLTQQQPKFHLEAVAQLVDERLDPIISPGAPFSQHSHTVFGGSMFSAAMTYEQTQQADCSSISVQSDKSNYWMPSIYAYNDTGFVRLQLAQRFYYLLHHWVINAPEGQGPFEENIYAFPKGFSQTIGSPERKTTDMNNVGDVASSTYWCNQKDGSTTAFHTFPSGCDSIKATIQFPGCWNGVDLYLNDSLHMAWPVNFQNQPQEEGGFCPASHPVRLPQILFESNFDLSEFNGDYQLVLANGDTTGAGMHADFFNGWDTDVLQGAIDTVYVKGATPSQSVYLDSSSVDIPVFANPTQDIGALLDLSQKCVIQQPVVSQGLAQPWKSTLSFKELPGCNKLWASGPKPTC